MTEGIIEAVARALCRQQIISNLRYDPPRDDEDQFIQRCEDASWNDPVWLNTARAAITAYEAARGDVVGAAVAAERDACAQIVEAFEGKPCGPASGWTAEFIDGFECGQMDATASVADAIRARAMIAASQGES